MGWIIWWCINGFLCVAARRRVFFNHRDGCFFFAIRHARGEPLICPYILLTPLTTVSIVPYLPLFWCRRYGVYHMYFLLEEMGHGGRDSGVKWVQRGVHRESHLSRDVTCTLMSGWCRDTTNDACVTVRCDRLYEGHHSHHFLNFLKTSPRSTCALFVR
jgi:hypothetical protein